MWETFMIWTLILCRILSSSLHSLKEKVFIIVKRKTEDLECALYDSTNADAMNGTLHTSSWFGSLMLEEQLGDAAKQWFSTMASVTLVEQRITSKPGLLKITNCDPSHWTYFRVTMQNYVVCKKLCWFLIEIWREDSKSCPYTFLKVSLKYIE